MLATVSSHVGPYQLIEQIGIGGMAEVFKASQAGEEGFERMVERLVAQPLLGLMLGQRIAAGDQVMEGDELLAMAEA